MWCQGQHLVKNFEKSVFYMQRERVSDVSRKTQHCDHSGGSTKVTLSLVEAINGKAVLLNYFCHDYEVALNLKLSGMCFKERFKYFKFVRVQIIK